MQSMNPILISTFILVFLGCAVENSNKRRSYRQKDLSNPSNCKSVLVTYQQNLKPIVESRCVSCHSEGKPSSFVASFIAGDDAGNSFKFRKLMGGDGSAIYRKVSDAKVHGGGEQLYPEDKPKILEFFTSPESCSSASTPKLSDAKNLCKAEPLPKRVNLLSSKQYRNAVLDLTGVTTQITIPAAASVLDGNGTPRLAFSNDQKSRSIDSSLFFLLEREASSIAGRMTSSKLADYQCSMTERPSDTCIRLLAERAFRRPLSNEELVELREFESSSELLRYVLLAPQFLYLTELGENASSTQLNSYEIASLLAFTLTGFPPDEQLLRLAQQGKLQDANIRLNQAKRLLTGGSPYAPILSEFFMDWLELTKSKGISKSAGYDGPKAYQESLDYVKMQLETEGSLIALFSDNFQGRTGILEQKAFLASHSNAQSTSPVKIGKSISSSLLCISLPPPPPNVSTELKSGAELNTTRKKLEAHTLNPSCSSCHTRIDPFGLAFEGFDQAGLARTMENGVAVDTRVRVAMGLSFDGDYSNSSSLIKKLAESPEFLSCFESFFQQHLYGVQSCAMQAKDGYESLHDYVARLIGSDRFINRK